MAVALFTRTDGNALITSELSSFLSPLHYLSCHLSLYPSLSHFLSIIHSLSISASFYSYIGIKCNMIKGYYEMCLCLYSLNVYGLHIGRQLTNTSL